MPERVRKGRGEGGLGWGNSCYLFGLRRCSQCGGNWVDNILWRRMLGNGQGSSRETFPNRSYHTKVLAGIIGFTWADYQRVENSLFHF